MEAGLQHAAHVTVTRLVELPQGVEGEVGPVPALHVDAQADVLPGRSLDNRSDRLERTLRRTTLL